MKSGGGGGGGILHAQCESQYPAYGNSQVTNNMETVPQYPLMIPPPQRAKHSSPVARL